MNSLSDRCICHCHPYFVNDEFIRVSQPTHSQNVNFLNLTCESIIKRLILDSAFPMTNQYLQAIFCRCNLES